MTWQAQITILAPQTLSGITASLNRGSAAIVFDQQSVEMLLPDLAGFLPVDALDGVVELLIGSVPDDYVLEMKGRAQNGCAFIFTEDRGMGYAAASMAGSGQSGGRRGRIFISMEQMIMSMEISQFTPV